MSELSPFSPPDFNVLLVEDNPLVRQLSRSMLDREGYRVVEAADGIEALRALQTRHFHLVVTDLVMPDCDGLELIRKVRAQYPEIKILAVSGVGSAKLYLKTAHLLGAAAILAKPFDRAALLTSVQGLLELPSG